MKAVTYDRYGGPEVLSLVELEKPVPDDNEVLVRIYATSVSAGDWRARSLEMPPGFALIGRLVFGVFGPRKRVLGQELSGVVEAIGRQVTKFAVGDQVIAYPDFGCYAEYITIPEDGAIALKPFNLNFEEAAAIGFGGCTALDFLKEMGNIQSGEKVLVVGASGSTGSAAVQLAKYFGAHVTGVTSTGNLELVSSIGADEVIDYKREDFSRNGKTYDIIVDTVGTAPWSVSRNCLTKTGRLLVIAGSLKDMVQASFVSKAGGKKLISGVSTGKAESLRFLVKLVEAGDFKPIIDRVYPLEKIVEAHAYVDTGRKRGNVVITIAP